MVANPLSIQKISKSEALLLAEDLDTNFKTHHHLEIISSE